MERSKDLEIQKLKRQVAQLRQTVAQLRGQIAQRDQRIKKLEYHTSEERKKPTNRAVTQPGPYGGNYEEDPELAEALALSMAQFGDQAMNEEDMLAMAMQESLQLAEPDPIDSMSYEQLLALEEEAGSVSTGLNEEQINSFRTFRYAKSKPEFCSICQGSLIRGIKVKELYCLHLFHIDCVDQWLKLKKTCPVCLEEVIQT